MNVIEFHTWNALARRIGQPDRVIFDLDPGEGERWERVVEAATLVRGLLQELALESWLKTSGGKGLHVVVPLTPRDDWDTVRTFAQAMVQHLAQVIPQRFVARMGAANRVGKVFVDYLRNNHGATTAAAFSARARPGLGVSMPLAWDDLGCAQARRPVDRAHRARAPVVSGGRPVARLLELPADADDRAQDAGRAAARASSFAA